MKYILLVLIILFLPYMAYATHESTQCDISIYGEILPVSYITETRGNPDNSFHPGDAFHYLFTFTGIPECISFSVDPVISEGVFNVISHQSITWNNNNIENTHAHQDLEMQLQYLTTIHYYRDTISYIDCNGYRCQEITLAENPSYSVREDQEQSTSLQNLLDGLSTASTYTIRTEETQDWGFANDDDTHEHDEYSHTNESDESIESFEDYVESKCNDLEKYGGCVFGHVELELELVDEKCLFDELYKANISHDMVNDECVNVDNTLSLSIVGTKINCYYLDGLEICESISVEQTKNIIPNVLSPEFEIILTKPPVKSFLYYDSKNLSGTYYPNDVIAIIHDPSLLWKEVRAETIQFETSKVFDLEKLEDYDCKENNCNHTISVDKLHPSVISLENGQGISLFNAELGNTLFYYTIIAKNLGREINRVDGSIDADVVVNNPKYESHGYPLLADVKEHTFDDRQAVVLDYFGNERDGVIHTDERSLINGFYNIGVMYDAWNPNYLKQNFTFSAAFDGIEGTKTLESYNNTVMFLQAGFGKLYFDWPVKDIVIPTNVLNEYYNVTSYTTLSSNNFAGKDTMIIHYELRYPETAFTKDIIIKSINQNGDIINDKIELEIIPFKNRAEYLDTYIYDKVLYDTDNEGFAKIISEDTNPIREKIIGFGIIDTTIAKTIVPFDNYESYVGDSIQKLDSRLIDTIGYEKIGDELLYKTPYDITLSHLTPQTFKITINDSLIREIDARYYEFGGSQNMTINTQQDNTLEVERKIGFTIIKAPQNFGYIDSLFVNEEPIRQKCSIGCTLYLLPPSELEIVAKNIWGGTAHATVEKEPTPIIKESKEPDYILIITIGIIVIVGYNVYRFAKSRI